MNAQPVLGRGLGSLIPHKQSLTEQVIPSARTEVLEAYVGDIRENPRQPRQHFSPADLEDLIGSIKEHGIMQPLVVTRDSGSFELIAGERRLRAARTLGLKTVLVIKKATDQQNSNPLIENIHDKT